MKLINEKSVYFKRTLHNFRIQLLLYQQLFSPSTQRTAMRNNFLLVGSNLTLAYFEEKSLWILPQIYANINFHDINLAIINKLHFDIYHKPTILVLGKLKNLNKKLQD